MRTRPWAAFLVLFALFSILGPYDLNNRTDHEETVTDLKAAISGTGAGIEEGRSERRFAVVGLLAFALLAVRYKHRREQAGELTVDSGEGGDRAVGIPIVAFIALATLSVLWADDRGLAVRRIFVFLTLCYAAWALARSWSLETILLFTLIGCLATLCASLGLEIMRGAFHPVDGTYRLAGLTHPNNHAQEAAVAILSGLTLMRLDPTRRRFYSWAIAGAGVMLLLTRSRTSLLSLGLAFAIATMLNVSKRRALAIGLVSLIVVLAVGVFGASLLDSARHALLMGRSQETADVTTLTGRTELWAEMFKYIAERPFIGYGYDSFWTPAHTAYVALALGWVVPHAHNGYIEMALELGYAGVAIFVWAFMAGVRHAFRRLHPRGPQGPVDIEALCAFTVLVWAVIEMLSETVLPQTHYALFLVMMILAREAMRSPAGAPAPVYARVRAYTMPA